MTGKSTPKECLEGPWREWRHARVAELTRPYGWTALVSQDWLSEGAKDVRLEGLPGSWSVDGGRIIFTPPRSGPTLCVDGAYPADPVEIVPGRNQTYGHGNSVPVYFGTREVETIARTTIAGPIYAVRVRDPMESARKDYSGLETFDYDPAWRVPAQLHPTAHHQNEAETVEIGVRETVSIIGTLSFTLGGTEYQPFVIGKDSKRGMVPVLHIRDATNGELTYEGGRVVELEFADDSASRIDFVDFNYLHALPCAFTNFVTCPRVPPENQLDVAVLAGEKRPNTTLTRIFTYEAHA